VFDHESRFRESVIEHFADEYMAGRTLQHGRKVH
jgi:tRNA-specific 2-thiouridylase